MRRRNYNKSQTERPHNPNTNYPNHYPQKFHLKNQDLSHSKIDPNKRQQRRNKLPPITIKNKETLTEINIQKSNTASIKKKALETSDDYRIMSKILDEQDKIAAQHTRTGIMQCHRCQYFGPNRTKYEQTPRCVKRGGNHFTEICKKKNKNRYHLANHTGRSTVHKSQKNNKNKATTTTYEQNNINSIP